MTVESATYIHQLDDTKPPGTDILQEGDNHIRLIKSTLRATFPNVTGAVNTTQGELNVLDGADTGGAANTLLSKTSLAAQMALLGILPQQCRLNYINTTTIGLRRFNGKYISLKISGTWQPVEIPSIGVDLSNSGFTASTGYYIYAYWTGAAIAIEKSSTAYVTDSDTGFPVMSGDATRLLVGIAAVNVSSQFFQILSSGGGLGTISYWNPLPLSVGIGSSGTQLLSPSGSYQNLSIISGFALIRHPLQVSMVVTASLSGYKTLGSVGSQVLGGGVGYSATLGGTYAFTGYGGQCHVADASGNYYANVHGRTVGFVPSVITPWKVNPMAYVAGITTMTIVDATLHVEIIY